MIENMRWAYNKAKEWERRLESAKEPEGAKALESLRRLLQLKQMAHECAKDAAP